MNSNFKNTCILFFTTQLNSEKIFSPRKRKQQAIQKILFEKTLSEIQHSGLSYVISDGKAYGSSFEDRLKGATNGIFQLGYQNIIIVGDDTPNLSTADFITSYQNFENQILTIGPTLDGGSYLISLNKQAFEDGVLENLSWQSRYFYEDLLNNLRQKNISYYLLKTFVDLDDERGLNLFLSQAHPSTFQKILSSLFDKAVSIVEDCPFNQNAFIQINADRGPPLQV